MRKKRESREDAEIQRRKVKKGKGQIIDTDKLKEVFRRISSRLLKARRKAIGLYIDPNQISMASLVREGEGWRLEEFASVPTPEGTIKKGKVTDGKKVGQAIRHLLDRKKTLGQEKTKSMSVKNKFLKNKFLGGSSKAILSRSRRVVTAIGGGAALIRFVELPPMPPNEMREALRGEVDQYVVFGGDEAVLDFHPEEVLAGKRVKVLLSAVRKDICNSYLSAFDEAGLKVESIDVTPLSVMRALSASNLALSPEDAAMLVVMEPQAVSLNIIKGKNLCFSRNLDFGEEHLSSNPESVEELVREIKLALNFYHTELSQREEIGKVVLAGNAAEGSRDSCGEKFKDIIAKEITSVVEVAEPMKAVEVKEKEIASGASLATTIGLAMRGEGSSPFPLNLNLLPLERVRLNRLRIELLLFLMLMGLVLVFFLGNYFSFRSRIKSVRREVTKVSQRMEESGTPLARTLELEKRIRRINLDLKKKRMLAERIEVIPYQEVLEDLKTLIPKDVWLFSINSGRGKGMLLEGGALSKESVFRFLSSLNKSDFISSVNLNFIRDEIRGKRAFVNFELSAEIATD